MKGVWLEARRLRLRDDLPVPEPPAGEALVRVLAAGICNTDLELVRGYYPYTGVLGHEFAGEVVSDGGLAGKRVVGEINAVCGDCRACRAGRRSHCERRTVLGIVNRHGAFAEYLTLPIENLHVIPDGVSTEVAVFTEPLAAALEIQEQVAIGPGDRVRRRGWKAGAARGANAGAHRLRPRGGRPLRTKTDPARRARDRVGRS
jgi:threonine dehydrogenase-like Zn-dependent dehydrogenase